MKLFNKLSLTKQAICLLAIIVLTGILFATRVLADGSVSWVGNGQDSEDCQTATNYIHWVFTPGGNDSVTAVTLKLGGSGTGSYTMDQKGNGAWQYTTSYFDLSDLTASANYTGNLGSGNSVLTISDYCSQGATTPTPTVTPTITVTPTETCTPTPTEVITPTPTEEITPTPTETCTGNLCVVLECPGGGDCEVQIGTPSATPTATVTPTPTTGSTQGSTNNTSSNSSSNNSTPSQEVLSASTGPSQAVLGASTLAATGTFSQTLETLGMLTGLVLMAVPTLIKASRKSS